jgi:hypothetical protein
VVKRSVFYGGAPSAPRGHLWEELLNRVHQNSAKTFCCIVKGEKVLIRSGHFVHILHHQTDADPSHSRRFSPAHNS